MSTLELQQEEREVLHSIYEGDERFKEVSTDVFQYRVGEDASLKTFLVDVKWGDSYPDDLPHISLDAFYNKLISPEVKAHIISQLLEQAAALIGSAMTYSLFEYAKDSVDALMPDSLLCSSNVQADASVTELHTGQPTCAGISRHKEKKEQLTKAQKRRQLVRHDDKGEMPRGWNWVDVVKHLRQTGRQVELNDS